LWGTLGRFSRILVAFSIGAVPTMLFAAEETHVGSCTVKTTIYCANVTAGLMLGQFDKWLRRLPVEADVQVNLLSTEVSDVASR